MYDYQTFVFGRRAVLSVVRLQIVNVSLNMSSKTRKSSCPFASKKKTKGKVGRGGVGGGGGG